MHVIYVNYYSDSDPERRQEYLDCLIKNQQLSFIDHIVVFLEKPEDQADIVDTVKLEFINLGRRLEFRDAIDHADRFFPHGTIITILNLDIFLEDSKAWQNIDQDFFNQGQAAKAMVLKRHNLDVNHVPIKEHKLWSKGNFCDGWVFKTPIDPGFAKENLWFCVGGAPGCDNLMMHLMNIYYHTFSWGDKYRSYHLDICRKNGTTRVITNDNTDWRAYQRRDQHARISADQDWEFLLISDQRPVVTPDNKGKKGT